jgi:hypothetical protein
MNKTAIHKQKILEILRSHKDSGINSKYLISEVTPRYSARINDLKKEGYYFKTKRENIGGSNFIRIWLLDSPKQKPSKPVRYEFYTDSEGRRIARAIYG